MRNCSSALNLSLVCILTRNCTEGSGVCLDRMMDCFRFVKKWSPGDIGNIVSFSIIFFQEPLKRWYGNVISMLILRSFTVLVTFWVHRKYKIVASEGQSLQHFHGLLEKHWTEFNHIWQRCSLLCPTQVLLLFMLMRKKINKRRMCLRTQSSLLSAKWA